MNRIALRLISIAMMAAVLVPQTITLSATPTNDFSSREDYYVEFCMSYNLSEADEATCNAFYDYLGDKNEAMQKELDQINKNIKSITGDITKVQQSINKLSNQIKLKQAQITATQKNIDKLAASIAVLEEQIRQREHDIELRHNVIKTRMESSQSLMATNAFADFIMGAKDFVDLIRRVEGVNDITTYDKQQIMDLEEQKRLLEADKQKLNDQKAELEKQKVELEASKKSLEVQKTTQETLLKEYRTKEAQLEAAQQKAAQNLSEVRKALTDLSTVKNLKPSKGWTMPVKRFNVSAGSWYYPASFCAYGANRCVHLGADFAAPVGTPIYAPASAVILYVHDKCPTYGGLGNWCGTPGSAGAGNHILMAMEVDGRTYAVKFAHLQSGISKYIKWPSPDGKAITVLEGVQIGTMGSSGNSSGPHTHIEIIGFGSTKLESVINTFRTRGQFDFGLGWGNAGLNTTCNKKGYLTPCRYRPEEIFNVAVGKSYSYN